MTPLRQTAAWKRLESHHDEVAATHLRQLFAEDPGRGERLRAEGAGLLLDYSKHRVTGETLELLIDLARERGVPERRDAMLSGQKINSTEGRAVLHTALRAPRSASIMVDGHDVVPDVHEVLGRMAAFARRVRDRSWLGGADAPITNIVNIGIGGSDLGPVMAHEALKHYSDRGLVLRFVSNVDGTDFVEATRDLDPARTLFIVSSKTFTTLETMANARSARRWVVDAVGEEAVARHFVAVSTNAEQVEAFGIDIDNMFGFWDWVGGRYSMDSAIGLSTMIAIGPEGYDELLSGFRAMDEHFATAPLEQNLPVILALVGFWNREFLGCPSVSIAPYHQDLNRFPAYLQQLDMESNGKRVTRAGDTITDYETCPVIWGDVGTNGQHAYFQLLHQGTDVTPMDFIAALRPAHEFHNHHAALLANCFAQSEAFMKGKTADEVRQDLAGQDAAEIERLVPHKTFPGNRPSNTILMEYLTPATLGALIALYEHKTFVQGALWDVNSFDQWGVELGKVLAKKIEAELNGAAQPAQHDGSTNGLIARAKAAV